MVSSPVKTPEEYLLSLPEDRRAVIGAVRHLILENLPPGYVETINWGMLSYEIPLETFSDTYNGQPLSYIGLAAQKNYYALYLMSIYAVPTLYQKLLDGFKTIGKKPDIGKSCVRFRKLEDLPLEALCRLIAAISPEKYIEVYKSTRS